MTENVCTPVTSAAKKLHAAGRATGVRVALGGQKPASIGASGRHGKNNPTLQLTFRLQSTFHSATFENKLRIRRRDLVDLDRLHRTGLHPSLPR